MVTFWQCHIFILYVQRRPSDVMWFVFDPSYCLMTALLSTQLERQDIPNVPSSLQGLAALEEVLTTTTTKVQLTEKWGCPFLFSCQVPRKRTALRQSENMLCVALTVGAFKGGLPQVYMIRNSIYLAVTIPAFLTSPRSRVGCHGGVK